MSRWRTLLAPLAPRLCAACGGVAGPAEPLCSDCRGGLRWLPSARVPIAAGPPLAVWAPVAYEGPARDVVHALKFGRRAALADLLAAQIAARAPDAFLEGALVPVPLHPWRLRRRGFNQAEAIARALGRRTGLVVDDCLARTGHAPPQAGRDRQERLSGGAGAVAVGVSAPPSRVLLVDDVVTTGATLAACAAVLRAAGSREVTAVAWARTPGR